MPSYIIYHDQIKQRKLAQSVRQAVGYAYAYLETVVAKYNQTNELKNCARIVCYNPDTDIIESCPRAFAEYILEAHDCLELYARNNNQKIFASSMVLIEDTTTRETVSEKNEKKFENLKETESHMKILSGAENSKTWKIGEVDPVVILQTAEVRLFSHQLSKLVDNSNLSVSEIEKLCDLGQGTITEMVNAVDPVRPTQKTVDTLARFFKVEPVALWVDLVSYYLETTGRWKNYI